MIRSLHGERSRSLIIFIFKILLWNHRLMQLLGYVGIKYVNGFLNIADVVFFFCTNVNILLYNTNECYL